MQEISEISIDKLEYEQELKDEYKIKEFQKELKYYYNFMK